MVIPHSTFTATARTLRIATAALACLTSLGGCTGWPSPATDSGLALAQSGDFRTDACLNSETIEAPAGVHVVIRPSKDKLNRTILLNVTLLLPPGVEVQLARTEVVLQSPEWPVPRPIAVHHISAGGSRVYPPAAVMNGAARKSDSVFTLRYSADRQTIEPQTGVPHAVVFSVGLPPLEIDGEPWQAKPVRFTSSFGRSWFGCGL